MRASIVDRIAQLDKLNLSRGAHDSFEEGCCATELVSWLADETFSERPACLSPVLGSFLRSWNDSLAWNDRQGLKPFLPRAIGTANDSYDEERAWLATDWLVRVCTPAWLELAGIKGFALALRLLPPVMGRSVDAAQPIVNKARAAAEHRVVRAVAGDAAWAAAGDATKAAKAAKAAAGDTIRVARDGRAATWVAARAAARDVRDVRDATRKLEPTGIELQTSAFDLLDRMIMLGEGERTCKRGENDE